MPSLTKPSRYVSYLRVSTRKQGTDGLGIEAQRQAVAAYIRSAGGDPEALAEYVEQESGKRNDRPELAKAMEHCRLAGARLVIAKLDRLSRNAAFLLNLKEAGVDFVAADMPDASEMTIGILAVVAQAERRMISDRTKAALKVARQRIAEKGQRAHPEVKRLGNPKGAAHLAGLGNGAAIAGLRQKADARAEDFRKTLVALTADGITSARGIANALNARGFPSPRGGAWTATAVLRLQRRLAAPVA